MKRTLEVIESRCCKVDITFDQAAELNRLGKQLVSSLPYWRNQLTALEDEHQRSDPSVITCTYDGTSWSVFVSNAVGIISITDLQLRVSPKIPWSHFVYLLGFSRLAPRFVNTVVDTADSIDLLQLIAHWFINALDDILRHDLLNDYTETADELSFVRGQLEHVATAQNYYTGSLRMKCVFDEFSCDTPLNRILKAAALLVFRDPELAENVRRRSALALHRLEDVSDLRSSDLESAIDRRSVHYANGIYLARLLIQRRSRGIDEGDARAYSFLIPSAGPVEEGIRFCLQEQLSSSHDITKRNIKIGSSALTLNPDLVFDAYLAVGDVKYKVYKGEWPRPDLYQAIAFATGFRSQIAVIVSFAARCDALPPLIFGDVRVFNAIWATDLVDPAEANWQLAHQIQNWIESAPLEHAAKAST